jgi:hypothetical protein
MNKVELIERTGFHDSSLATPSVDGNDISLRFNNVWTDGDSAYKAAVELHGVTDITRNGKVVDILFMEDEYANVIDLSRSGHTVALIVDWRSFSPPKNETCSYKIAFTTFDLEAEKQE